MLILLILVHGIIFRKSIDAIDCSLLTG